jgi:hypothetical protein
MTKLYKKPCISSSSDFQGIIPLAAVAAAVAGSTILGAATAGVGAGATMALMSRKANISDMASRHLQPVTYKAT